jgi:hypothetical protein
MADGIKHHINTAKKDHQTDSQHKPIQPSLLLALVYGVKLSVIDGRTAGQIIDSVSGRQQGGYENQHGQSHAALSCPKVLHTFIVIIFFDLLFA